MASRDMYNSSGCLDMTAFLALRNIAREEKDTANQPGAGKRGAKAAAKIAPPWIADCRAVFRWEAIYVKVRDCLFG